MTFMDDIHASQETEAYKATRFLVLWLQTIAPTGGIENIRRVESLISLAREMNWPVFTSTVTGLELLGEPQGGEA